VYRILETVHRILETVLPTRTLHTYLLTYIHTYLLHGAETFLRS